MNKRYKVILAIFVLLIISFGLLFAVLPKRTGGISAKESVDRAYNIAQKWNENAILGSVRTIDSEYLNGKSSYWIYGFLDPDNDSHFIDVRVYSSGKTKIIEYNNYTPLSPEYNITELKWNIDSTDAYKIAMKNQKVKDFVSKYGIRQIEYSLTGYPPRWTILLRDWGLIDDPHHAMIVIDAITGEVLYVDADYPSGPTDYEKVCLPPVIAAMTLLFLLIFVCGRFSSSLALGFSIFLLPVVYLRIYYSTPLFTLLTVIFWFILWLRVKKLGGGEGGVEVRRSMQAVTWVLAGDYFGLLLARFLLLPYTHPTLLWGLFILLNALAIALIADEEDRLGVRSLLRSMRK